MRRLGMLVTCLAFASCPPSKDASVKRASLKRLSGSSFELIPEPGQLPYCLAYTVSEKGVIRQLTMSEKNVSFTCAAGQNVGTHPYRVPADEPRVRVYVLFSSQPVNAASVSQQIFDAADRQKLNAMDLRLPGQAALETLEFALEADVAAEVGGVISSDAGAP